jgi:hypothetical protein
LGGDGRSERRSPKTLCDNDMTWYAIRTVYCWGQKSDGKNVFDERVVAFSGTLYEEVLNKAKEEATAYSSERRDIRYEIHPDQSGYELDEANWVDGLEVWSEMFESDESLQEFYENRYRKYDYHPE